MSSLIGRSIGKYEIQGAIGHGGMASVYLGYQRDVDRKVAVKVLPPHPALDDQFVERFQLEARTIARLQHPHILPLYDYGVTDDNIFFLVMPYIEGGSLDRYMGGKLDLMRVDRILREVAGAMDYAHRQGVIHRDIKPANILLDKENNTFIADFGIAKLAGSSANLTGTGVVGTPAYMSPEQAQGLPLDSRSDIYSLGVVVYELLAGRPPFMADTPMQLVLKHINEIPPNISSIANQLPQGLDAVMERALEKDPNARYQTAAEFADAFSRLVRGRSTNTMPRVTVVPAATSGTGVSQSDATTPLNPSEIAARAIADTGTGPSTVIVNQGVNPRWIIGGFMVLALLIVVLVFAIVLTNNRGDTQTASVSTPTVSPTRETTTAEIAVPTSQNLPNPPTGDQLIIGAGDIAQRLQTLRAGSFGRISYGTSDALGDTLNIRVERLPAPPDGQIYVMWLMNTDTGASLNVGRITRDASGSGALSFIDAEGRFLPGEYNLAYITLQESLESEQGQERRFSGLVPADLMSAMSAMYIASENGFSGRGLIDSALREARFAEQHAGLAARSPNVAGMISHVEHTLNILRGGSTDYDGNGSGSNPGTGRGLYAYLDALDAEIVRITAAGGELAPLIQSEAELMRVCVQNVRQWADEVAVIEERLLGATSLEEVAEDMALSTLLTAQMTTGVDQNENGLVEPFEGECGLQQLNEYGMLLATIDLFEQEG